MFYFLKQLLKWIKSYRLFCKKYHLKLIWSFLVLFIGFVCFFKYYSLLETTCYVKALPALVDFFNLAIASSFLSQLTSYLGLSPSSEVYLFVLFIILLIPLLIIVLFIFFNPIITLAFTGFIASAFYRAYKNYQAGADLLLQLPGLAFYRRWTPEEILQFIEEALNNLGRPELLEKVDISACAEALREENLSTRPDIIQGAKDWIILHYPPVASPEPESLARNSNHCSMDALNTLYAYLDAGMQWYLKYGHLFITFSIFVLNIVGIFVYYRISREPPRDGPYGPEYKLWIAQLEEDVQEILLQHYANDYSAVEAREQRSYNISSFINIELDDPVDPFHPRIKVPYYQVPFYPTIKRKEKLEVLDAKDLKLSSIEDDASA